MRFGYFRTKSQTDDGIVIRVLQACVQKMYAL